MLPHAGGADESLGVLLLFSGLWVGWAGWSRLKNKGFPRLPTRVAYVLVAAGVVLAVSAAVIPRRIFGPTGIRQTLPGAVEDLVHPRRRQRRPVRSWTGTRSTL